MKNGKLSALLNTPLGAVIAMGAVVLVAELLFMMLFHEFLVVQFKLSDTAWDFIDAVTLVAVVSPALYFLVFRKIQEGEERLRQINASAQDAIVIVDEQALITEWNLAAQRMFQYSREEAVGRQMHQLIAPSRYRADAARGFARFEETGGGPLVGKATEVSAMRKDGSEFPIELTISAVRVKDRWHAMGIIRDITERRQVEERLRASEQKFMQFFMEAPFAMGVANKDGAIVYFNKKFTALFGYTGDDVPTLDEWWLKAYPDETYRRWVLDNWNRAVAKAVKEGIDVESDEYTVTCKNGAQRIVIIGGRPFEGGVLVTFNDVTGRKKAGAELQKMLQVANQSRQVMLGVIEDQKRAEESLRQLNAELENKVLARTADLEQAKLDAEQANRAKSAFLAAMSHEIRTPMNGVVGMIDVLHQSSLHGYQVEMVDLIRESAYSLLGIINDILDFSKIEADKLEIEYTPTSVAEVVENTCGMLDSMAMKKGVELTLFTDPEIPAEVIGDAMRLRQVLVNLTNNAIKFSSKQQPGRVSVRALLAENGLAESTPEQILLELRITDNGIGMDEKTVAGLFTPFTQADISTTRRFGGTGLGLSIAHHLVELMGGKITVQSELGKGSVFTVRLPFELLPAKPAANAAESPVTGLSCLVVGGTENLAGDISAYLTHDGAVVERAPNMVVAGERAGTLPPGMRVWVIDAANEPPSHEELRAVARAHPEQETRFVVIGRGPRRKPRLEETDLVSVDGNALTRGSLLKAVGIAAGRIQIEKEVPPPGKSAAEFKPPSRDDALRQNRLILVAEDNETNQKVILRQLALLGFAADIADNGRMALERWRGDGYALLLCDLHMPEMDGYELTTAIRAAERGLRHIPIVALTANALKGEAERCRAIGMDDYLSKPVQLADLKAMLEKWMPVAENRGQETAPTETVSPTVGATSRSRKGDENRGNENRANENRGLEAAPTPVDVNVLKALVGDDEAMICEFLHDFRLSAAKIAAELRAACAANQTEAAGALAHKLKSSSRSVGALALGELCAAMEQAGKAGDAEALATLLPKFEQELAGVEGFLEGY